jgi:hypothetical protein
MSKKTKIVIIVLMAVIICELWIICKLWNPEKNIIPNRNFMYSDLSEHGYEDNFVSVEGTWISDTDLYNPIQSSVINCWKDMGICVESKGYLSDNYLFSDSEFYEIDIWNEKEIISKLDDSALCTSYIFRINRVQKQATLTRTIRSTEGDCSGISEDAMHLYLTDGLKAWNKNNKK